MTISSRLLSLFNHLNLDRVHIASYTIADWHDFTREHPDRVATLTLANTFPGAAYILEVPTLAILGDAADTPAGIESVEHVALPGYTRELWDDVTADRSDEVVRAMTAFISQHEIPPVSESSFAETIGEVEDLTYSIKGSGPPLVLLPLALTPSQWEPIVDRLSEQFCTITIRGALLGFARIIEVRGQSRGYLAAVRSVFSLARPTSSDDILEVGCATGVLARWMARETGASITAFDLSPYLLDEARKLAEQARLDITFEQGNAERLPYEDNRFDITCSYTVLEELNAERAFAEIVRVTKPGGRIVVLVRALDTPVIVNLPLPPTIKAKAEAPPVWWGGVGAEGCADISLYDLFHAHDLQDVTMMPLYATYTEKERLAYTFPQFEDLLDADEIPIWRQAVAESENNPSAFVSQPLHAAVGIKP